MAHKTIIDATAYEITGGAILKDGTKLQVEGGKTIVDGTGNDVRFSNPVEITISGFYEKTGPTAGYIYAGWCRTKDAAYGISDYYIGHNSKTETFYLDAGDQILIHGGAEGNSYNKCTIAKNGEKIVSGEYYMDYAYIVPSNVSKVRMDYSISWTSYPDGTRIFDVKITES